MEALISLLYVSRSQIAPEHEERAIADIITVAQSRNAHLNITGALVFTQEQFAQVLEGSAAAVHEVMGSIRHDHRHTNVNIVAVDQIPRRRFEDWVLAYAGPSTYVERRIKPLLPHLQEVQKRSKAVDDLLSLVEEFVRSAEAGS